VQGTERQLMIWPRRACPCLGLRHPPSNSNITTQSTPRCYEIVFGVVLNVAEQPFRRGLWFWRRMNMDVMQGWLIS